MPKQILIVDDNEDSCQVFTRFLRKEGYEVILASDGDEGLQKIEQSRPDLVLLDVMLPGINGFEVCRRVKNNPSLRSIPIFIITAGIDPALQEQGLNVGAEELLSKPVRQPDLILKIRSHLDKPSSSPSTP
ncbi:MAG: response regulator [Candidatus Manganitrophus sp.]|nr:response regulator [Candidatus Manganitrophus sp.]